MLVALHHVDHLAACRAEDLDDLAGVLARHVHDRLLDGLEGRAVFLLVDDLRAADLELVALAAHRLHEHRKVQHPAAGNLHAVLVRRLGDAHRDVGLGLAKQALLELASAYDIAVLADERARVRREDDRHRRLLDVDGVELDRRDTAGEHIADVGVLDPHDRDHVTRMDLGGLFAAERLEGVELLGVCLVTRAVVLDDEDAVAGAKRAREHAPDGDAPDEARVVDGADLHGDRPGDVDVGSRDMLEDRVKERHHVVVRAVRLGAGVAVYGARVDDREVELRVVGTELDHEVEDRVDDLVGPGAGPIDLVDDDHRLQSVFESVPQDEARLGHGPLEGVDDEQDAVGHLEHPLDLTAEIRVARRVDDVDLGVTPADGDVLREDGDAALALLVA